MNLARTRTGRCALLLLCLACLSPVGARAQTVTRGPYLQIVTPTSIVVRWRTDVATDSEVNCGTSLSSLTSCGTADLGSPTKEHQLTITGLSSATKYFYSVGTTAQVLSSGSDHFFVTAPAAGTQGPTRVWAIGDFGTSDVKEQQVRDSYKTFTRQYQDYTHVWLMLGDNAYADGQDSEYQTAIFDPTFGYQTLIRRTVAWPTLGNHDAVHSSDPPPTIPYFLNFTLPTNGEAGGEPSGTAHYYAFDYANVHFVCLDAQTAANPQPGSPMLTWLANDLSSTNQDWIIAYWHHPPYSHGSHNSDTSGGALEAMRQNVVPILEAHGVDLVLTGHSHDYERSFLIDGHYGSADTWDPSTMLKDGGSGRVNDTGAYRKPTIGPAPHEGALYVVAGSGGQVCDFGPPNQCGALDYPAMYVSYGGRLGSLVLDIKGKRLDAKFLRETGVIDDYFTIIKGPLGSLSIEDVTVTERDSGTKNAVFTVTLEPPAATTVRVDYQTVDGTATTADGDYMATAGTLTFPHGAKTRTLSVPIIGDALPEPDETFSLRLQNADGGSVIADDAGLATILDNDTAVFGLSAANYTVSEAIASATITVRRTGGLAAQASLGYAASDGTATGADYTAPPGSLTFAPGVTSRTFSVAITRDALDEPDETVLLRLTNPSAPSLLEPQNTAVLTIVDNDAAGKVQLSAASYGVTEPAIPASPPTQALITLKRTGGRASAVRVHYDVSGGTATPGTDYTPISGDLTFDATGPGATARTFSIDILPDAPNPLAEGAETVNITLSAPGGGATLGTPSTAVLTIQDSEPTLEFTALTYTAKESTPTALVTAKRSGPLTGTVTVDYATSDGTATSALTPDYTPAAGTLTFAPRVASRTFTVAILKDTLVEGNETLNLTLSNAGPTGMVSMGAKSAAVLTITDDDVAPTLQFSAASYTVTEASPKATITVKRTGSLAGQVSVAYAATGGTALGGGTDYTLTPGGLTFGPGVAVLALSIPVVNDTLDEGTETVALTLSNPGGGAVIGTPNPAVLSIADSEPTVQFAAAKYAASEAAATATITVRRMGSLAGVATVAYAVTAGTAGAGSDYSLSPGTLTFGSGVAVRTIAVTLIPDTVDESHETVVLTLSNPTNVALGTPEVTTLTLTDNDTAGRVQFGAAAYSVGEGGGTATITVTRSGGTASQASVDYAASDGGATSTPPNPDYSATGGTLTFGLGETTKTFTIPITDDALVEGNETIVLTLSNPAGGLALGAQAAATLWIVADD